MKKLSLLLALPLLLFVACDEHEAKKDVFDVHAELIKEFAEEFKLSVGETVLIKSEALTITFTDIAEDSRCPLSVNCVWAGRVSVQLEVVHQDREFTILLTLGDGQNGNTYEIDGIQITLIEVTPYPEYPDNVDLEDYAIKLIVNKV